ncbi:uncharacterized protein LOC134831719 [Culicoides brevitarsis]|uniref:uncharacterized protein LOC134831719 n=1 Tax=Culicoides brevitarsis TaxID=469753 RepID=UPI00307C22DD
MEDYMDEESFFLEADLFNPIERHLRAAVVAQNPEKIKELLAINRYPLISVLYKALQVGNLEIVKLLFESGCVYLRPVDEEQFVTVIRELDPNSLEKVEIVKFLLTRYFLNFPVRLSREHLEVIDGLLADKTHNLFEYLLENFYSEEKNKLFPLMKKLEVAVQNPHVLLILLHEKINTFDGIDEYVEQHFSEFVRIFKELLLTDTPETIQLTIDIFQVLLEKEVDLVLLAFVSQREFDDPIFKETHFEVISPVLLKRFFHVIYILYNLQRKGTILNSIFYWFELCCWKYRKYYRLSLCMIPFIMKPIDRWDMIKIINVDYRGFKELERLLDSDKGNVVPLKGICRNVILTKSAQVQGFDAKRVLVGLWALNLHADLKCYLLRIPDPSWMNDLNF